MWVSVVPTCVSSLCAVHVELLLGAAAVVVGVVGCVSRRGVCVLFLADSFIRLGCIATFWNLSSPSERLRIIKNFITKIFPLKGTVALSAWWRCAAVTWLSMLTVNRTSHTNATFAVSPPQTTFPVTTLTRVPWCRYQCTTTPRWWYQVSLPRGGTGVGSF